MPGLPPTGLRRRLAFQASSGLGIATGSLGARPPRQLRSGGSSCESVSRRSLDAFRGTGPVTAHGRKYGRFPPHIMPSCQAFCAIRTRSKAAANNELHLTGPASRTTETQRPLRRPGKGAQRWITVGHRQQTVENGRSRSANGCIRRRWQRSVTVSKRWKTVGQGQQMGVSVG
jgi:hypothetical protein